MDRSSFNRVETTNDHEKRLAFKAKLAEKLQSPPKMEDIADLGVSFNGVPVGGILVHPSLGEGTLIEVNHASNEVLIDFGANGLVGLVLSQAKSFVHAPVKKVVETPLDPFIGGEIQSRMSTRPEFTHKEVKDWDTIVSPDFVEPKKTFLAEGTHVWHPEFGYCLINTINEKANSIVLRVHNEDRELDLVLSQVRSKLVEAQDAPDHVPTKELVREPLSKQVPAYSSPNKDVAVTLPEVFKLWTRTQQFLFLSDNQHLTTEQANDVFSVLNGQKPVTYGVTVSWKSLEATMADFVSEPLPTPTPTVIAPIDFSQWGDKRLWHPDFGECSVSSIDAKNNELILLSSAGHIPFVLDVTLPKLAVITASGHVDHAPKQLGTRVLAASDHPVVDRQKISVTIPEVIVTWRTVDQYQYLTNSLSLTPEHANEIIASLAGTLHSSKNEYEIIWTKELPEAEKRAAVEQSLLQPKEQPKPSAPVVSLPVDPGVKRVVEEVAVVKKEVVLKTVVVNLPLDLQNWNTSGQYVFLTRTRNLTSNEANDLIDIIKGKKPHNNKIQYEINWS